MLPKLAQCPLDDPCTCQAQICFSPHNNNNTTASFLPYLLFVCIRLIHPTYSNTCSSLPFGSPSWLLCAPSQSTQSKCDLILCKEQVTVSPYRLLTLGHHCQRDGRCRGGGSSMHTYICIKWSTSRFPTASASCGHHCNCPYHFVGALQDLISTHLVS